MPARGSDSTNGSNGSDAGVVRVSLMMVLLSVGRNYLAMTTLMPWPARQMVFHLPWVSNFRAARENWTPKWSKCRTAAPPRGSPEPVEGLDEGKAKNSIFTEGNKCRPRKPEE